MKLILLIYKYLFILEKYLSDKNKNRGYCFAREKKNAQGAKISPDAKYNREIGVGPKTSFYFHAPQLIQSSLSFDDESINACEIFV